jgi:hypothetical protein
MRLRSWGPIENKESWERSQHDTLKAVDEP